MSRIRLYGDTTGYIELKAPDVSNNIVVEFPEAPLLTETDASNTYAPINSPSFSGEVSFVSASVTGIDLLPSQSENTGKFLSTDGTNALWETLSLNFDNDQNIIAMQVFR
jgi:hypothetical protein